MRLLLLLPVIKLLWVTRLLLVVVLSLSQMLGLGMLLREGAHQPDAGRHQQEEALIKECLK